MKHAFDLFYWFYLQSRFTRLSSCKKMIHPRLFSLNVMAASMVLTSSPVSGHGEGVHGAGGHGSITGRQPTIIVGSELSLSSVRDADWIQGEGPKSFEPGKVYIFECWATWSRPCVAMIPHVNELHNKYYDKGLRVYGMSVWEKDGDNDRDRLKHYVKKKGEGMAYPIAFTDAESAFAVQWLTAAGVKSIPHVFIVRDGKLLASTQVSRLTDSLIESLLSGDEGAKNAADIILASQKNKEKATELVINFSLARKKKNLKKMSGLMSELKGLDPGHPEIDMQELWVLIVSKQWDAAVKKLEGMPESEAKTMFVGVTGFLVMYDERQYSEEFEKALVHLYSDYVLGNDLSVSPSHYSNLSMLQWRNGDKKNAAITANKGLKVAKNYSRATEGLTKSFERFVKSVNEGVMPSYQEVTKWRRDIDVKKGLK